MTAALSSDRSYSDGADVRAGPEAVSSVRTSLCSAFSLTVRPYYRRSMPNPPPPNQPTCGLGVRTSGFAKVRVGAARPLQSLDAVPLADDPRFLGVQRLYGDAALERLRAAHVCVVGVGGVGSWAAEALARCGVGQLTLVDLDEVCITNVNRQVRRRPHTCARVGAPPNHRTVTWCVGKVAPRSNPKP